MPGDDLLPATRFDATRAITIDAAYVDERLKDIAGDENLAVIGDAHLDPGQRRPRGQQA